MRSYCCFFLRFVFLVQKTAHARVAVREPQDLEIVGVCPLFASWRVPFLSVLLVGLRIPFVLKNGAQLSSEGLSGVPGEG